MIDAKDYVSVQINEGFLPLCLSAFFGRDTPNIVDENGHVVEHEISVIIGQSFMRSWVVAYDMGKFEGGLTFFRQLSSGAGRE
jgi:hypothetical protein